MRKPRRSCLRGGPGRSSRRKPRRMSRMGSRRKPQRRAPEGSQEDVQAEAKDAKEEVQDVVGEEV